MAGRAWTSTYEWYAHERYARDEGIDAAVIAAIAAQRRTPDLLPPCRPRRRMVWRVTDELLYTRRVTDATYAEALAVLGERRLLPHRDDRRLLRVRVDAAQRRSLSAAGRRAAAEAAAAHGLNAPLTAAELCRVPQRSRDGTPRDSQRGHRARTRRARCECHATGGVAGDVRAIARRGRACSSGAAMPRGPGEPSRARRCGLSVRDGAARRRGSSPTQRSRLRSMPSASAASSTSWCSWGTRTFFARSRL